MINDRDILITALESVQQPWAESKHGKSLLAAYPPDDTILAPIVSAIEQCKAYQAVSGWVLFSANSGPVLHAPSLALPLLFRAEQALREGHDICEAADWVIRLLGTRYAEGVFKAAIWGLSIDKEIALPDGSRLIPFEQFPDSHLKRRIVERAHKPWDDSVWLTQNFYDVPRVGFLKRIGNFPYIRRDNASFLAIQRLEKEAYDILVFLQGKIAGHPLAFGHWFEYEDQDLDLNAYENYISWVVPEIEPRITSCTPADSAALLQDYHTFLALPPDWRNNLTRSMERFTLSRCRHQIIDRILDLTLAFEIAVSSKGENTPLSWKVSVRSAQLIGGALKMRQETRRRLTALYSLRNKGTHGSSLKDVETRKQEKVFEDATVIYRDLLKGLLRLGRPPDWNSIELEPTKPTRKKKDGESHLGSER
jgi:hypothetical protein